MLSFFRRALSSWVVLGFLALLLGALVVTGVGTPGSLGDLGSSGSGERLANIGSQSVTSIDVTQRLNVELDNLRQQQPGATMSTLVDQGAVEGLLSGLIDLRSVQAFGEDNGMFVSKRMIDGQIASVDAFKGATGKFDRTRFEGMLQERGISERQIRDDIARDLMARLVGGPVSAGTQVPTKLAAPFASLMLEARQGQIALVPSSAMGSGATPTPKELQDYYQRNRTTYTVPEQRVVRYALFDPSRFAGKASATDGEIQAYFTKNLAKYGGRESRKLTQVIVQSEAAAKALAAKISSGGDITGAAKAAGVEAISLPAQEKAAFAKLSSASVAESVFKTANGQVAPPTKSGLGWHVVRVDGVSTTAGKSLASVRGEIAAELSKEKAANAFASFITEVEDAIGDGQTFDEVARSKGLAIVTTPAVTASGLSVTAPGFKAPEELAPVLKDLFQAEAEDDPVVLTVKGDVHALADLDTIIPSAPRPLAQITAQVTSDFVKNRAARTAKSVADAIAAKANAGGGMAAAISGSGKTLPPVRPVAARRIDLLQAGDRVPPPLALMFSIPAQKARVLEAPNNEGWFVVWLDKIIPGQASSSPELVEAQRRELSQYAGKEIGQQFTNAVKAALKVTQSPDKVARLKKSLSTNSQ